MSNSPFFSVIIPTYNRPQLAERAIESVLQQQFQDFEILLIDDGSDDDYSKVAEKYKSDKRFIYLRQNNAHLSAARNKGIKLAQGQWICFLDDDDYYLANHFSELESCINLNNRQVGLYRTFTYFENENGVRVPQDLTQTSGNNCEYILNSILTVNNVCLPKQILLVEKFDEELRIAEDYNMWLRLLSKIPLFESLNYTTIYFRATNTMSSYNLKSTIKYLESYPKTFRLGSIQRTLNYEIRKKIIFKYLDWYFDLLRKEKSKISLLLVYKISLEYPSINTIRLLIKYYIFNVFNNHTDLKK